VEQVHEHGHGLGDHLYLHRHTKIHELPAAPKLAAAITFIFAVVLTPREAVWAFACYFLLLILLLWQADLPARKILKRTTVEIPFLIFALLMPFFGPDPQFQVGPLELSETGSWAAFGIIVKGTLGVLTSILLSATTRARDLLRGLEQLKVPGTLVQIATFMLRYSAVVLDEMRRMDTALKARGFEATGPRHWKIMAASGAALFIRSYERGERVHLAMLSRGYTGNMPDLNAHALSQKDWLTAFVVPTIALLITLTAWVSR
jgi:cobalt/nickel transport system permease protein